jgi:GntR family transcriptional regulator
MADSSQQQAPDASQDNPSFGILFEYFTRPGYEMITKQMRLQRAVIDSITEARLQPGDRIPAELELSKYLGVSLGTTQGALGGLARQGLLDRRQGKGTFVAENRIPEDELWHFRFIAKADESKYLPVFTKTVDACRTTEQGPWASVFGKEVKEFIKIDRVVNVDQQLKCLSRIYLPAHRFGGIIDNWSIGKDLTNIKFLLRRNFGVTNTFVEQTVRFSRLGTKDAAVIEADAAEWFIQLAVFGYEADGTAISYHEIYIPPNDTTLDLSYSGAPITLGTFGKGIGRI